MSESTDFPSMKPVEAHDLNQAGEKGTGPVWARLVGFIAVILSIITLLIGIFLGWWVMGMAQTPVSPLMKWGGYLFNVLPVAVLASLILATIAGIPGGLGRRLGLTAGIVTFLSLPAFFLLTALVPVRN